MAKHKRNVPHDTAPVGLRCMCRPASRGMVFVSPYCPTHDPRGYAAYQARHATDSIVPVDRDPWSGKS